MRPKLLLFLSMMAASGCGLGAGFGERPCSAGDAAAVLAVGDSILAWNAKDCASIPDVVSTELSRDVNNASVSGALLSAEDGDDIRGQYSAGGWGWVIVDGGANDLNGECECGECGSLLDDMVSEGGDSGEMPEFLDRVIGDGSRVVLMAYYDLPENARWGFDRCADWFDELRRRYSTAADLRPEVVFVDPAQVVDASEDLDAYVADRVHPSPMGAERIGAQVAAAIAAAEAN